MAGIGAHGKRFGQRFHPPPDFRPGLDELEQARRKWSGPLALGRLAKGKQAIFTDYSKAPDRFVPQRTRHIFHRQHMPKNGFSRVSLRNIPVRSILIGSGADSKVQKEIGPHGGRARSLPAAETLTM